MARNDDELLVCAMAHAAGRHNVYPEGVRMRRSEIESFCERYWSLDAEGHAGLRRAKDAIFADQEDSRRNAEALAAERREKATRLGWMGLAR